MFANITRLFAECSDSVHRRLETEGQAFRLNPFQTIMEYIVAHFNIHLRMHQAHFLNIIEDETTTIRFIVNGLGNHAQYKEAPLSLRSSGLPSTAKILQERLLE